MDRVATIKFTDYGKSVARALDAIAAEACLPQNKLIMLILDLWGLIKGIMVTKW